MSDAYTLIADAIAAAPKPGDIRYVPLMCIDSDATHNDNVVQINEDTGWSWYAVQADGLDHVPASAVITPELRAAIGRLVRFADALSPTNWNGREAEHAEMLLATSIADWSITEDDLALLEGITS